MDAAGGRHRHRQWRRLPGSIEFAEGGGVRGGKIERRESFFIWVWVPPAGTTHCSIFCKLDSFTLWMLLQPEVKGKRKEISSSSQSFTVRWESWDGPEEQLELASCSGERRGVSHRSPPPASRPAGLAHARSSSSSSSRTTGACKTAERTRVAWAVRSLT